MTLAINLLPDVRQAKLKAKRRRQLAIGLATGICGLCIGTLAVLVVLTQAANLRINQLTESIHHKHAELMEVENLIPMLTAQQNLRSLPGLYKQRIMLSMLFDMWPAMGPQQLTLSNLEIKGANELNLAGRANSYATITKLVQAMQTMPPKDGSLVNGLDPAQDPHFTSVNLTGTSTGSDGKISFTLTATMSPGVTSSDHGN